MLQRSILTLNSVVLQSNMDGDINSGSSRFLSVPDRHTCLLWPTEPGIVRGQDLHPECIYTQHVLQFTKLAVFMSAYTHTIHKLHSFNFYSSFRLTTEEEKDALISTVSGIAAFSMSFGWEHFQVESIHYCLLQGVPRSSVGRTTHKLDRLPNCSLG